MSDEGSPTGAEGGTDGEADDERQRRIEALRAIARDQQQLEPPPAVKSPSQDKPPTRRKPRRTRWLVASASIICVVVIGALVLRGVLATPAHRAAIPTPPPTMLTLRPAANGIGCADDVAWSPHGTSIAVLGAAICDSDSGAFSGVVDVYRAADGKFTSKIPLDGAIRGALAGTSLGTYSTVYQHVSWSPDGKTLAVSFSIFFPDNPNSSLVIRGVALSSPAGAPAHVLMQHTHGLASYMQWNLSTGSGSATPDTLFKRDTVFANLPPALSYQWTAQGKVVPDAPLPTNLFTISGAPPSPAPGNPIGDATFTIWQPGVVTLSGSPIGVYTYQADYLAWSPDGRYLVDSMQVLGRLPSQEGTPSTPELTEMGLGGAPVLPVKDSAMVAAQGQMHMTNREPQRVSLAWRGNGVYLAAQAQISPADAGANTSAARHTVVIYDCNTGDPVAFLTPERGSSAFTAISSTLRWSPDGSHLLLYDPNLATITIWGPSLLPK